MFGAPLINILGCYIVCCSKCPIWSCRIDYELRADKESVTIRSAPWINRWYTSDIRAAPPGNIGINEESHQTLICGGKSAGVQTVVLDSDLAGCDIAGRDADIDLGSR